MRVTGVVLPVYAHNGWQVETMMIDLGSSMRERIEIRHGEEIAYAATIAERDVVLREHGIDPARLAEVDAIDDGCE